MDTWEKVSCIFLTFIIFLEMVHLEILYSSECLRPEIRSELIVEVEILVREPGCMIIITVPLGQIRCRSLSLRLDYSR